MVSIIQYRLILYGNSTSNHGAPARSLRPKPLRGNVGATHQEQKKVNTNATINIFKSTDLVCESIEGLSSCLHPHPPISLVACSVQWYDVLE
jgi:hypothetical protein